MMERMLRFFFLVLGIGAVSGGIGIYRDPLWCSAKYQICSDMSGYNVQVGTFLIIGGLAVIGSILLKRRYDGDDILMCPECMVPIAKKNTPSGKCQKCDAHMEPLEGFYERHPELKDK